MLEFSCKEKEYLINLLKGELKRIEERKPSKEEEKNSLISHLSKQLFNEKKETINSILAKLEEK